jgi:hypothetical protein
MSARALLTPLARSIVVGVFFSGIVACCASRGGRSETPPDLAPALSSQVEMGSPADSAAPMSSATEAPIPTPSADTKIRVDQTPALKRCREHNLAAISQWGVKVGTFCKQGGCRIMESPAKIYEELLWCGKDLDGAWGVTMTDPTLQTKKNRRRRPTEREALGNAGHHAVHHRSGWHGIDDRSGRMGRARLFDRLVFYG